ncbi:hypothetical protein AVBRAN12654_08410, partial [Campylobacter sp. RM12654]|nr:hypothetical protein [Campylobacter sp. RM12654]
NDCGVRGSDYGVLVNDYGSGYGVSDYKNDCLNVVLLVYELSLDRCKSLFFL